MSDQPSYYAILTAEVRYDKNLSPLEKLLFAEITALSNKEGYCWASNAYFGKLYNLQPNYVSRVLSRLAKSGYIRIEIDKAAGNLRKVYIGITLKGDTYSDFVLDPIAQKDNSYSTKVLDPYSTKVQPNTITTNTITNTITNTVTADDKRLADKLYQSVLINFPFLKDKPPKQRDWIAINQLHRLDGRDYVLIEFIISWSQRDRFWSKQIRSSSKLRKQFDTLMVYAKSEIDTRTSRVLVV